MPNKIKGLRGKNMVVTSNILAMNVNRMLGITTKDLKKRSEKLSSGYKINRSADDAAGLSISEKMRKQIRGLFQSAENIQDGISLCQVTDGALNETVDILQRMNELSVQAANGTNSDSDRQTIQFEIDQLVVEIDRIATTTKFNEIYPLCANTSNSMSISSKNVDKIIYINDVLHEISRTFQYASNTPITYDGITYQKGDYITVHGLTTDNTCANFDLGGYWDINVFDNLVSTGKGGYRFDSPNSFSLTMAQIQTDANGYLYYISQYDGDKYYLVWQEDDIVEDPLGFGTQKMIDDQTANYGLKLDKITADSPLLYKARESKLNSTNNTQITSVGQQIWIQSTDEAHKGMFIHTVGATAKDIGINGLNVQSEDNATNAINTISDAIRTISEYRSYFGAIQNRLEHAYNINLNIVENTQYAESKIRDTDMATEMVKYSNSNILAQAGLSVLAQANQMNQSVLRLIS